MERHFRTWWIGLFAASGLLVAAAPAGATTYAPLNRPGPKLSVPAVKLAAALTCDGPLAGAAHPPVLLVPGTTLNPTTDFSYGWEPTLRQLGYRYCTIDLPGNGMANIATAGEYVVYAIRTMHAAYGGRIDIIGHSQGGMVPRWALRFWPDTRAMVDDLIGLSPSNHGTLDAIPLCKVGCAASIWQQRSNAKFIAALNSRTETFAGISYTDVYTLTDEVVVPNFGPAASSALHGGGGAITNVAIQTVCPTDPTEHIGIGIFDDTAYALALDALTHPGPADPSRVARTVCLDPLMPGVDPVAFPVNFAKTNASVATTLATYPHMPAEPRLACYVTATCSRSSSRRRRDRSGSGSHAAAARRSP
jgi:pimeloyl-ACP methyl ester carboxylesterase